MLAAGLGKRSPLAKAHLVISSLSADAQGRPRTGATSTAPPLVLEPLLPRWLSCPLLCPICTSGSPTWILPCPTQSPYRLCASPKPSNTGNHTECQYFRVPSAEYLPIQPLLPRKLCLASECPCWAQELQVTLHMQCARVQAILSFLLLP